MLDPNHPELMKLDPRYKLPPNDALQLYAYASQGNYGDVTGDRPGVFSVQDRLLWDAWNGVKGETKDQAKVNFINKGKEVLQSHGFPTDDPDEAQGNKDYQDCLEAEAAKRIADGDKAAADELAKKIEDNKA